MKEVSRGIISTFKRGESLKMKTQYNKRLTLKGTTFESESMDREKFLFPSQ